jgi:hypothetical protein
MRFAVAAWLRCSTRARPAPSASSAAQRARALEPLTACRRAGGADDEPFGDVHLDERLAAADRDVEGPDEARERTEEAARTRGLEARLERAFLLCALAQDTVRDDERLDLLRQTTHVGRALRARPELVPRHHEERGPAEPVIGADPAHDLEAPALDALRVDEDHVRVERPRTLDARTACVRHGDGGLAGPELLRERIGARGIAVDHEHPQAFEDARVDLALALGVDEGDGASRTLVQLVDEGLGARDERRELADELLDRGCDRAPRAEHDAERLTFSVVLLLDCEDAVAELAADERDQIVEGGFTELVRPLRTLGEVADHGGDPGGDGVGAGDAWDHPRRRRAGRRAPSRRAPRAGRALRRAPTPSPRRSRGDRARCVRLPPRRPRAGG